MLDTYFKNKGVTKTIVHNNGVNKVNKIKWEADYNGDVANISIDVDDNGTNEHYTTQLTNEDLDNILNIPSVNKPIDQRLLNDFTPLVLNKCKIKNRKQTPMFIDFEQEPLLLPLRIRRKYTRRNKTAISRKHKNSKKSRR
jgi:hypothetical protein